MSAGGDRQTSAALDLALRQLSTAEPSAPRLLLLYTSAPDAGGKPVADLIAQLKAVGAVLVAVGTAATGPPPLDYWSAVSAGTKRCIAARAFGDAGTEPRSDAGRQTTDAAGAA